jgi:uncharacterized membrane protein YqjE
MRRLAALLGLVVLVILAVALFWRVYRHHHAADPYLREEATTVELRTGPPNPMEDFAGELR